MKLYLSRDRIHKNGGRKGKVGIVSLFEVVNDSVGLDSISWKWRSLSS